MRRLHPWLRLGSVFWVLAFVVSSFGPVPSVARASAAPAFLRLQRSSEPPAEGEADQTLDEARSLYQKGKAKFETYDYEGAIEDWTEAYATLDETPRNREIRNNLVYNIALAQEKAFDLDGDVAHLRQAKALLEKYLSEYETLYKDAPDGDAEIEKVRTRIAEIDARIAEQAGAEAPTEPTEQPAVPAVPPPADSVNANAKKINLLLKTDPDIAPRYKSGRGMRGGGIAMVVVGGVASFAWFGVRNPDARIGAAVVGSIGLGLVAGGIPLIIFGHRKRRSAIEDAYRRVGVTPTASRHGGGFSISGRF